MHQYKRGKFSDYGRQLREKQKVKRCYGILERQFRRFFAKASRMKGNTGENLLQLLELRIDNIVFLSGFATSRAQARQYINHGHFNVNGRRVTIPSQILRRGDEVALAASERIQKIARENKDLSRGRGVPTWLLVDENAFKAAVNEIPKREQVSLPVEEQLIVEFCSK
jgi:small subunit ribosomal protein S4